MLPQVCLRRPIWTPRSGAFPSHGRRLDMKRAWTMVCVGVCLLMAAPVLAEGQEPLREEAKTTAGQLLAQGDEAFQGRRYAQAAEVYKLAVETAKREGEEEVQVEALAQVARSYLIQDKKEEGRPWLERAEALASNQMPLGWSRYLGVRGRFEWQDGMLEVATATFKEMYQYCLRNELHSRAVDAAHMVAITASHEEQVLWPRRASRPPRRGILKGGWGRCGTTWAGPTRRWGVTRKLWMP